MLESAFVWPLPSPTAVHSESASSYLAMALRNDSAVPCLRNRSPSSLAILAATRLLSPCAASCANTLLSIFTPVSSVSANRHNVIVVDCVFIYLLSPSCLHAGNGREMSHHFYLFGLLSNFPALRSPTVREIPRLKCLYTSR